MDQKRNYVRVDDYLPFEYTLLEKDEFEKIEKDYIAKTKAINKMMDTSTTPVLRDIIDKIEEKEVVSDIDSVLMSMLINLDKKLDLIIDLLDQKGERKKRLKEKTKKISLSGGGIKILTDNEFKRGDILELRIDLPLIPPVAIPALGEVARSEKTGDKEGGFKTAIKFKVIQEEDRDKIIHYVFQKQRELLRAKKEEQSEE
jgi:hypothetical protein